MSVGGVTLAVRLRPELLDDVAEAFAWYEAQAEGVGRDFTRAFFAAVACAVRQPQLPRVVYAGFRRVRLPLPTLVVLSNRGDRDDILSAFPRGT